MTSAAPLASLAMPQQASSPHRPASASACFRPQSRLCQNLSFKIIITLSPSWHFTVYKDLSLSLFHFSSTEQSDRENMTNTTVLQGKKLRLTKFSDLPRFRSNKSKEEDEPWKQGLVEFVHLGQEWPRRHSQTSSHKPETPGRAY